MRYLEENPIGEALISENLYALSPSTRRSPDVAVILGDHQAELREAKVIHVIPDIAAALPETELTASDSITSPLLPGFGWPVAELFS